MADDDYAIVVGIDEYPGTPGFPAFDTLGASENDGRAFMAWLLDAGGGDVPIGHVEHAFGSDLNPNEPTASAIAKLFEKLVGETLTVGRVGPVGRRLYIFMAGHGFSDPQDMDSAALFSAEAHFTLTLHIAGRRCAEWFRRNGAFTEIVLVMDCCRDVNEMTAVQDPPFPASSDPSEARKVSTFYAYATEWGQTTREIEIDGATRGVFTTALLDALTKQTGRLTRSRVADYVHNRVSELLEVEGAPGPQIHYNDRHNFAFVTRDTEPGIRVSIGLEPFQPGMKLALFDGISSLRDEYDPVASPHVCELPPGFYKAVVDQDDGRSHVFEVVGRDVDFTI